MSESIIINKKYPINLVEDVLEESDITALRRAGYITTSEVHDLLALDYGKTSCTTTAYKDALFQMGLRPLELNASSKALEGREVTRRLYKKSAVKEVAKAYKAWLNRDVQPKKEKAATQRNFNFGMPDMSKEEYFDCLARAMIKAKASPAPTASTSATETSASAPEPVNDASMACACACAPARESAPTNDCTFGS